MKGWGGNFEVSLSIGPLRALGVPQKGLGRPQKGLGMPQNDLGEVHTCG